MLSVHGLPLLYCRYSIQNSRFFEQYFLSKELFFLKSLFSCFAFFVFATLGENVGEVLVSMRQGDL